jgi:membrane protein DedA with SNARE-associated domain
VADLRRRLRGGIVWAGIYTAVSYLAGSWLQQASGTIDWILGGIAVGAE